VASADIAWAAADVLTAAAQATGSPELQQAAEGFSRAARASWGRIPASSPGGTALRTAAYLLAGLTRALVATALAEARRGTPPGSRAGPAGRRGAGRRGAARARRGRSRLLQAAAAHRAAASLAAEGSAAGSAEAAALFSAEDLFGPPVAGWPGPARAARTRSTRRRAGRPAARPGPGPAR